MRRLILVSLATIAAAATLPAQRTPIADRPGSVQRLFVFAPDEWTYGNVDAVISRAPGRADMIIVRSARPPHEVIYMAIEQLRVIRALNGESVTRPALHGIRLGSDPVVESDGGLSRIIADNLFRSPRQKVAGVTGVAMRVIPNRARITVERRSTLR